MPFFIILSPSCRKAKMLNDAPIAQKFSISGSQIIISNSAAQLIGANAFHIFGAGGSDMNVWNMDISREFIGDVKETPLTGAPVRDSVGAYLYSMQTVADSNRKNNRITVFCAFGWDGTASTLFTGTNPSATFWWDGFKIKLQRWAAQFKSQPDVWLEVWNEPYAYDGTGGYTNNVWITDMNQLVGIVRGAGNNNIILVPCAAQGQDEAVLNNVGASFLSNKKNILFDVHAYEKWLLVGNDKMGSRLTELKNKRLPVIFGETAPINAGILMNPQPFLDSAYAKGFSVCAWVWKNDGNDQDALLTSTGLPNNNNNNNWGTLFKNFAAQKRNP